MNSNSLRKTLNHSKISLNHSNQLNNGHNVHPSKKSEIRAHVDHAGHSEPLKLWVTVSVLPVDKNSKPESPQKIFWLAVDRAAEWDVMVDTHQEPGDGSKTPDVLQVIFTMISHGVHPTPSLPATITPLENMDLVDQASQLPPAKRHAFLVTKRATLMTNGMSHLPIQFHQMSKRSKLKSWLKVQSKLHSQSTPISLPTKLVSTNTLQEALWEVMQSRWLVGVLRMELLIGPLLTHGTRIGETMDSSKFSEERTNVESKVKLLLVMPN